MTAIRYHVRLFGVNPGCEAEISGYQTGKLTLVKKTSSTLVLKEAGHTYWRGIGMERGYAPAEYHVYQIESEGEPTRIDVIEITSFPVKSENR